MPTTWEGRRKERQVKVVRAERRCAERWGTDRGEEGKQGGGVELRGLRERRRGTERWLGEERRVRWTVEDGGLKAIAVRKREDDGIRANEVSYVYSSIRSWP